VIASLWPLGRSLAGQSWERATIDQMHLAFLAAEFRRIDGTTSGDTALITTPDLDDGAQNQRRRELLYRRREGLLKHVPESTEWFEVRYLERGHLHQVRAIDHRFWTRPGLDENEILKVARRMRIPLLLDPASWAPPILWGHTRKGPFTVLEGNTRLTAYAALRQRIRLHVPVFVGLSPDSCRWHLPDRLYLADTGTTKL
jgi:hypothetical protein